MRASRESAPRARVRRTPARLGRTSAAGAARRAARRRCGRVARSRSTGRPAALGTLRPAPLLPCDHRPVRAQGPADARRELNQAVETTPRAPRPDRAPGRERDDHSARVLLGHLVRLQAHAAQRPRPVTGDQHVSLVEQRVQHRATLRRSGVQRGAGLADHAVDGVQRQFGPVRGIDAKNVGAKCAEHAGADRTSDDAGQVQHPHPRRGKYARLGQRHGHNAQRFAGNERRRGHRLAGCAGSPLVWGAARDGQTAGRVGAVLDVEGGPFGDGSAKRCCDVGGRALGHAERGEQGRPVPGVVRVRPHPPVGGRPQTRERCEAVHAVPCRIAKPGLAAHCRRDVPGIERDVGPPAGAGACEVGCRHQAGGHRRERALGDRERRGQPRRLWIAGQLEPPGTRNAQVGQYAVEQRAHARLSDRRILLGRRDGRRPGRWRPPPPRPARTPRPQRLARTGS